MNADNSHAGSRILARVLARYDELRAFPLPDLHARHSSVQEYVRLARLDYITAAGRLADALARRAANKLENANG